MQDTLSRVVDCLAATTRYPKRLLTPDADLETDLGIDSVKLVEVIIALADEFSIAIQNEQRDASVRTVQQLADWVEGFLGAEGAPPEAAPPVATTPTPAAPPAKAPAEPVQPVARSNGHDGAQNRFDSAAPAVGRPHVSVNDGAVNGGSAPRPVAQTSGTPAWGTPPPAQNGGQTKPLAGRIALVTGSGRGVGKTIARFLAQRGATVIVNSFHSRDQGDATAEEIRAAGGSATHIWGSVANPAHVESLFEQIEATYGGLDILVCNASDGRIGSFMDLTSEDWDRAFRTNVSGHHHCAVKAARLMRARGGGSMVTLSAVGAHQYIDGLGAQGIVKASVESLTRYLACELGGFGIRVNCVSGGPVYGDLIEKFPEARAKQDYWESIIPDGQLCNPLELAETIAFLVSDAARGINGAVWMVDHGFSATADGQRARRVAPALASAPPAMV
ncbi:SDR family oxidoreductase [Botrimarina colliarenosi]|nr:SDR family oxidoreductase [Botrimarina colliarenosi]